MSSDVASRTTEARGVHDSLGKDALAFVAWMNANHFDLHPNVQLRYIDAYQGHAVIASGPIESDAVLFQIPKSCTLSWNTSCLRRKMPKVLLDDWNRLILAMMYEDSQPDSHWRTYLDILPRTLNTPVFWTDAQLQYLKGSSIEGLNANRILKDYERLIVPLLSRPALYTASAEQIAGIRAQYFSFEQYRRFGSLIMAYSFTDDDDKIVMVPMADMLNHRTGFNNARLYFGQDDHEEANKQMDSKKTHNLELDPEDGGPIPRKKTKLEETGNFLQMRTRRAIQPEEQLYNTYGTLPDSELLRKYGFVDGRNRWNVVDVDVALIVSTCASLCGWDAKEVERRKTFIKKNQLLDLKASIDFYAPQDDFGPFDPLEEDEAVQGGITKDIIAIGKIFAANPEEWTIAEKAILQSRSSQSAASNDDEDELASDDEEVEEDKKPETEQEPKKKGGDLIPVSDTAKLSSMIKCVFQARLEKYGADCYETSVARLSALPSPSTPEANEDVIRERSAITVKIGEIEILNRLISLAEDLAK